MENNKKQITMKDKIKEILEALHQAIYAKPQGHAFEISPANFPMSAIGG